MTMRPTGTDETPRSGKDLLKQPEAKP